MDLIMIKKIQAVKKYKRNQLVSNVLFYSLTLLKCTVLCSIPLWIPYLSSSMNHFVFVYVPKVSSIFFDSKFVFIFGNLIIVALIGESKIFYSRRHSESYHNEYISRSQVVQKIEHLEMHSEERKKKSREDERKEWIEEKVDMEKELVVEYLESGEEITLPNEDLNKRDDDFIARADDFIARVNKQRILEASQLLPNW